MDDELKILISPFLCKKRSVLFKDFDKNQPPILICAN